MWYGMMKSPHDVHGIVPVAFHIICLTEIGERQRHTVHLFKFTNEQVDMNIRFSVTDVVLPPLRVMGCLIRALPMKLAVCQELYP